MPRDCSDDIQLRSAVDKHLVLAEVVLSIDL